jgi:hypothetical protein
MTTYDDKSSASPCEVIDLNEQKLNDALVLMA